MRKLVYMLLVCLAAASVMDSCKKDKRTENREMEKAIVGQWNLTECYDEIEGGNKDCMPDMVKEDYPYIYIFKDDHTGQLDCHFCKKMNFNFRIYGDDMEITYSDKEVSTKRVRELDGNRLVISSGMEAPRVLVFERIVEEEGATE